MTQQADGVSEGVSRRKFVVASGVGGAAMLAGCTGNGGNGTPTPGDTGGDETEAPADDDTATAEPEGMDTSTVTAEGSSTVYPIANKGSSYWNSNPPASDGEYWGTNSEEGNTVPGWDELASNGAEGMRLADYFASLYGFEATGKQANPPFATRIGLSHSGTGCQAVVDGLVDIGNSSGPITAELGWSEEKANEEVVDHVLGRDGQPVVVSKDIYDAGVTELTGEEVRKIYQDEITNWSEVGGPDQQIFCIGRAEGSGTDTAFRLNMLGSADAPMPGVDARFGQNQQVAQQVSQNDGAIAYMALAFTSDSVLPIAIDFDGTVYEPDRDAENTIFDSAYPLNRDLHQYTKITEDTPSGTDMREGAFMNMFLTTFGQEVFVEANNYIPLPTKDIENEAAKLPDQA
jgi:phosphate transport system substrate-binding protein